MPKTQEISRESDLTCPLYLRDTGPRRIRLHDLHWQLLFIIGAYHDFFLRLQLLVNPHPLSLSLSLSAFLQLLEDSLLKQKELCWLKRTFFARCSSGIDSLARFHPVVIPLRWVSSVLLKASGSISARKLTTLLMMILHVILYQDVQSRSQRCPETREQPFSTPDALHLRRYASTLQAVPNNSSLLLKSIACNASTVSDFDSRCLNTISSIYRSASIELSFCWWSEKPIERVAATSHVKQRLPFSGYETV